MIERVKPEMLNKITSACSSADVIFFDAFPDATSLPGLKYWHICPESTPPHYRKNSVDAIRKRSGRDVEVTFGPSD
jgi:hypothetical protein